MKQSKIEAARIALIYLIIGVLWILLSDRMTYFLADENFIKYDFFQRYKGWFFILVTSIFLFFIIYFRTYKLFLSKYELQQTEQQLESSNGYYQSLFNHNPDAVFEINMDGKFVSINPQGEKILGHEQNEIIGKSFVLYIIGEEFERTVGYFQKAISGESQKFETTVTTSEGNHILLRCTTFPKYINGDMVGVFGIARDITQIRKSEEMLDQTEKMSLIGHLAAGLAHEIRNPLTSIKGFVQLLNAGSTLSELHTKIMIDEIDRINLIVSEMLVLGKQQKVLYKQKDFPLLLKHVVTFMEGQANLTNVELQLQLQADREAMINCDENQIKQLFINLIKNGIESMPLGGQIHIESTIEDGFVVAKVHDQGMGMSEKHMSRLGEPFYSTKGKGAGLGLVVSNKIITQHQGTMEFKSEVGEGTIVTVRIPVLT
ncbi:ATP-binding protein [Bacillus sp. DJP31]|uniref:ATP-binding protein n=1 Tax=Bacillus sp. DJP31 TaxID=3409789 RepID=UPI003BB53520